MDKLTALGIIDEKSQKLNDLSDRIWGYAETAFTEFKSVKDLCETLESEGFEVKTNVADVETAFTGTYGSGKPVIGFLGEFDALSGLSQKAGEIVKDPIVPGGNGQGCGHNMLGVGSMAAAIATKHYLEENKLPGTVIYFGCPGEEGGSGKAFMAREDVFKGLDAAISWHPGDTNMIMTGSSLANVQLKYKFKGVSAHAASCPHLGRSALDAVALLNLGVQFLREHMIQEARIHYAITNTGGFSPNVVQPEAEVLYLIRAPKNDQVQELLARVNKIAHGAAEMTETKLETVFIKACSDTIPNETLERALYENFKEIPLPEISAEDRKFVKGIRESIPMRNESLNAFVADYGKDLSAEETELVKSHYGEDICDFILPFVHSDVATPGSTDVGDVSYCCPTAQINTATWALASPGHSWQIVSQGKGNIAHNATLYAGKVMAGAAIDCINNPEILKKARAEFDEAMHGTEYICPIPKGVRPTALKSGM